MPELEPLKATVLELVEQKVPAKEILRITGLTLGQLRGFLRRSGVRIARVYKTVPHAAKLAQRRERYKKARERVGLPTIKKRYPPLKHRERVEEDKRGPVTIDGLTMGVCHWMLDEVNYCGKLAIIKNGKLQSWCKHHYPKVFRPIHVRPKKHRD